MKKRMTTEAELRERALDRVYGVVDQARVAWRALVALRGVLKTFVGIGCAVMIGLALDNLTHLPGTIRC